MKRHQLILTAALVVQIVLTIVVFWPRDGASAQAAPIFPELASDDVVALSIEDGATDESLALARDEEGWVLPEGGDYPVLDSAIDSALTQLTSLSTGNLVAHTAASHAQLQVAADDFVRRIGLETGEGQQYILYLGSSPSYGSTHFRLEGEDDVYLSSGISSLDFSASADSWIDASYVSLSQNELTEVRLENRQGDLTFVRDDDGAWTLADLAEDEQADNTAIGSLVGRLASLGLIRPLGLEARASYGLDDPGAVVALETAEGETTHIEIGSQDDQSDGYVAKSSASDYYVVVSSYTAEDLITQGRADFLAQPTPTPVATPES